MQEEELKNIAAKYDYEGRNARLVDFIELNGHDYETEEDMPQRKFATALEIDTQMYSKMVHGSCRTQRLQNNENTLVPLWIANKIIVAEEKELVETALKNGETHKLNKHTKK